MSALLPQHAQHGDISRICAGLRRTLAWDDATCAPDPEILIRYLRQAANEALCANLDHLAETLEAQRQWLADQIDDNIPPLLVLAKVRRQLETLADDLEHASSALQDAAGDELPTTRSAEEAAEPTSLDDAEPADAQTGHPPPATTVSQDNDNPTLALAYTAPAEHGNGQETYSEQQNLAGATALDWAEQGDNAAPLDPNPISQAAAMDHDGDQGSSGVQHDLFHMLAAELADIAEDIDDNAVAASDAEQPLDQRGQAIERCSEMITRLSEVCATLTLDGLQACSDFLIKNLQALAQDAAQWQSQHRQLLADWVDLTNQYLISEQRDEPALALVVHLSTPDWPQPLNEARSRDLLQALLATPTELTLDEESEQRATFATVEDVALDIAEDVRPSLIDAFFQEAPEQAESLRRCLQAAIQGDATADRLQAAQRLTHTLKGTGNLLGVAGVANLAHHLEDLLAFLSSHQLVPSGELAGLIEEAADCLECMVDALQGRDQAPDNAQQVLQQLLDWANLADQGLSAFSQADTTSAINSPAAPLKAGPSEDRQAAPEARVETLAVPVEMVDRLFRLAGEMSISQGRMQVITQALDSQVRTLQANEALVQSRRADLENAVGVQRLATRQGHRQPLLAAATESDFDSLELDEYDEFYSATHSYIESVIDSREISREMRQQLRDMSELLSRQRDMSFDVQQLAMRTRMVEVGTYQSRLARVVRQTCRVSGKQAQLQLHGSSMLMDGDILRRLIDPLMHLLRNAVDHGIEDQTARQAAGKSAIGTIRLSFSSVGNDIQVVCEDDGAGFDLEAIQTRADQLGLLEGIEPSPPNLLRLLLTPGFSTRTEVTQISGRGVGLDVVHQCVRDLKGLMDLQIDEGGGSKIVLRVPLTLITSHSVIVRAADKDFAIPAMQVAQILPASSGILRRVANSLTYQIGDDLYQARPLTELLGLSAEETAATNRQTALLVRCDNETFAVIVDEAIGSEDIVVKGLPEFVPKIPGVAGTAVLGNGHVIAVLETQQLLNSSATTGSNTSIPMPREVNIGAPAQAQQVLIVDDSLSVRRTLSELVTDAGFAAITARDGIDAVDLLSRTRPMAVLADLEMPRMNGLELAAHVRANAQLADLPFIMITSRSQSKHRLQAEKVGVDAYLTKPYSEEELLGLLTKHAVRGVA